MSNIVEVLKSVPEVKLRILPLTWELLGEDGRIDIQKAAYNAQQVDAALAQAESYAQATERAVAHLKLISRNSEV